MKHFVLILIFFNSILTQAQIDSVDTSETNGLSKTYILDAVWKGRDAKKFETDGYPSFLIIENGVVTLFSKSRNKRYAYESRILQLTTKTENETNTIKFLGEQNYITPNRPSFEITEPENGDVIIYIYHTLGGGDGTYFRGHFASEGEVEKLTEYLKNQ